jgi:hypothetical protein
MLLLTRNRAVCDSGHWLMEEAPDQVIPKLVAFINKPQSPLNSSRDSGRRTESYAALGGIGSR